MKVEITENISLEFTKENPSIKEMIAFGDILKIIKRILPDENEKRKRSKRLTITDEIIKDVVKRFTKGESRKSIADSYGKGDNWTQSILKKGGKIGKKKRKTKS